jgi:inositol transporter-like SP family MFS transporter
VPRALIFMPFVDKVNRRSMATAQGFTFAIVRIGLGIFSFYVPDITKAVFKPLTVIMFCLYATASLVGIVFAPRNTQGRSLDEIHGSDSSRAAAARV